MSQIQEKQSVKSVKHPHLQRLLTENKMVSEASATLVSQFSPAQLNWKPDAKIWSMLENFDHLNIIMGMYFPAMEKHLNMLKSRDLKSTDAFKPTWFGKMFVGIVLPESTRKMKTVGVFVPQQGTKDPEEVMQQFEKNIAQLDQMIFESDGYALNYKKFASPASALVRLTLGEALWLQVAHNHRHLLQAKRLQELSDFPKV